MRDYVVLGWCLLSCWLLWFFPFLYEQSAVSARFEGYLHEYGV